MKGKDALVKLGYQLDHLLDTDDATGFRSFNAYPHFKIERFVKTAGTLRLNFGYWTIESDFVCMDPLLLDHKRCIDCRKCGCF